MFNFKSINWAFVLVTLVVVIAGTLLVSQITYEETITGTDEKGVSFTRNITKIGMGEPSKPKTA